MTKFESFRELADSWKNNTSSAIIYASGDDKVILTYHNLYEQITEAPSSAEVIRTDHSPRTVIRIFADVIGGNDILLIDENTSQSTEEQIRKSFLPLLKNRQACESGASACESPKNPGQDTGKTNEGRILFFTSGTTSRSRAVVLTTKALLLSTWGGQSMLECGKRDIILSILPLSHVFGFVCGMLWGLCYGSRTALGRGRHHLIDDCRYFRPTVLAVVPSMADLLLQMDALNRDLKTILIGAAAPSKETLQTLQLRGLQVYTGYGLTETASGLAIAQDMSDPLGLHICPGADLRVSPDGEISVKTEALMEGYLDPSDGSLNLPLENGRFMTGDLGRIDERGVLRLTGRKKDILVLPDGSKISCPEYESLLAEEVGSDDLCVILVSGRPALLYSDRISKAAMETAVASLNRRYPRSRQIMKLIPREGKLPRTGTGKIMRWVLENEAALPNDPR